MAPPFGDDGLKADEAREVVTWMLSTPVGRDTGVLVVGPMDLANPKASDVLLKCIEEFDLGIQPLLWAHDLGGVSPTVRSRCLDEWAPSLEEDEEEDESLVSLAWRLLGSVLSDEMEHMPSIYQLAGRETELLAAFAGALSTDLEDPRKQALWLRLREVARWRNPQIIEIVSALVGD